MKKCQKYDKGIDIWSFGMVAFYLFTDGELYNIEKIINDNLGQDKLNNDLKSLNCRQEEKEFL